MGCFNSKTTDIDEIETSEFSFLFQGGKNTVSLRTFAIFVKNQNLEEHYKNQFDEWIKDNASNIPHELTQKDCEWLKKQFIVAASSTSKLSEKNSPKRKKFSNAVRDELPNSNQHDEDRLPQIHYAANELPKNVEQFDPDLLSSPKRENSPEKNTRRSTAELFPRRKKIHRRTRVSSSESLTKVLRKKKTVERQSSSFDFRNETSDPTKTSLTFKFLERKHDDVLLIEEPQSEVLTPYIKELNGTKNNEIIGDDTLNIISDKFVDELSQHFQSSDRKADSSRKQGRKRNQLNRNKRTGKTFTNANRTESFAKLNRSASDYALNNPRNRLRPSIPPVFYSSDDNLLSEMTEDLFKVIDEEVDELTKSIYDLSSDLLDSPRRPKLSHSEKQVIPNRKVDVVKEEKSIRPVVSVSKSEELNPMMSPEDLLY